ncbi:MAG: DNA topoisomerase I [Candidatus Aenigmarchaeota archaeon]|nr:DNA topoisomerase I [Candidatus Aenigmarchaeota archaeon]
MPTLIIAEKPSSAQKIAEALAEGGPRLRKGGGVAYYEITRGGEELIVAPAVGHLFALDQKEKGKKWTYPVYDLAWKPAYEIRGNEWSKKYFLNLQRLAKQAEVFVSACDYDIEGSTIAFNIISLICKAKDGKRMKFSTLTKSDLIKAWEEASPHLDFGQIEAGLARHTLDFLWGINTSRALTGALKRAGNFKVLSTGRVQGPTLEILARRQQAIEAFQPEPYWELHLHGRVPGGAFLAEHAHGRFLEKPQAAAVHQKCSGKPGTVKTVERKQYQQKPPVPFDLTTLQREAYKHFGSSPKQTLDTAQALYERALISYPRTASQKLPPTIGYRSIVEQLGEQRDYRLLCAQLLSGELKPSEGPKADPAHPAIFPTGAAPEALNDYQKRLYDLIVRRFLAVFAAPAVRERLSATIDVAGESFVAEGYRTVDPQWMAYYGRFAAFKELLLPALAEGQKVANDGIDLLDKETQPPSRYTQATLLKEMEELGLGTKATRAGIMQTLYDRGYITDESIVVTTLGLAVITALEKYCPDIISVELTRTFDQEMEAIQEEQKQREEVVAEAKATLERILGPFKEQELAIGKELQVALQDALRQEATIGPCTCGGTLLKRRSRFGKRFVGCSAYPKCTQTFSLPQQGFLTTTPGLCTCGLFVILVKRAGKRPWKLCVRCGFRDNRKPQGAVPAMTAAVPAGPPAKRRARPAPKVQEPAPPARKRMPATIPAARPIPAAHDATPPPSGRRRTPAAPPAAQEPRPPSPAGQEKAPAPRARPGPKRAQEPPAPPEKGARSRAPGARAPRAPLETGPAPAELAGQPPPAPARRRAKKSAPPPE